METKPDSKIGRMQSMIKVLEIQQEKLNKAADTPEIVRLRLQVTQTIYQAKQAIEEVQKEDYPNVY